MEQLGKLIRRDWRYIAAIAGLFCLAIYLGHLLRSTHPQVLEQLGKEYYRKLAELARTMHGQPLWIEIGIIWLNNMFAAALAFTIGIFLPVLPLFPLIGNGLMIGYFQKAIELQSGIDVFRFYLALAPHGIFELSAFFIAVMLGIRFGMVPYRLIWQHHMTRQREPLFRKFCYEARSYWGLITGMLLVAAVIEVSVSPLLFK
jgi:stage II sporulation protein M